MACGTDGTLTVMPGFAVSDARAEAAPILDSQREGARCVFECTGPEDIDGVVQQCQGDASVNETWCAAGYGGPLCSNCVDGYARRGYGRVRECTECQSPGATIKVVALFLVVAIALGTVYWALGFKLAEAAADEDARVCIGVALVIGNSSSYDDSWRPTETTTADTIAMAGALSTQGYRVIEVSEGTQAEISAAVTAFTVALGEEQSTINKEQEEQEEQDGFPDIAGLIFFSGHGTHVNGQNYLVGVDGACDGTTDGCVSTQALWDALDAATNTGPGIVFLDAGHTNQHDEALKCPLSQVLRMRDPVKLAGDSNGWSFERVALAAYLEHSTMSPRTGKPLATTDMVPDEYLKERLATHNALSALKSEEPPDNVLLLFAALPTHFTFEPEQAPDDGLGFFARELIAMIPLDVNISTLCIKVRHRVAAATNGQQVPWETDNLDGSHQFCLSGSSVDKLGEEDEGAWAMLQDVVEYAVFDLRGSARGGGGSFSVVLSMIKASMPSWRTAISLQQILAGIPFAFDLQWPTGFAYIIDLLKVFQLDLTGLVEIGCMGSWSFYSALVLQSTVMPIVLGGSLSLMYAIRRRALEKYPDILEQLWDRTLEFGFTFFFLVYPVVSQIIFRKHTIIIYHCLWFMGLF